MSFTNIYYKRVCPSDFCCVIRPADHIGSFVDLKAVGTAKACYVCFKPTTTVLATINTTDFVYVCNNHLTDPGFATQVGESNDGVGAGGARKLGLSSEEIAKVKEEWEERQKKKRERAKEKEKEKESEGDKDGKDGKEETKGDKKATSTPESETPKSSSSTPATSGTGTPSTTNHQRYTLHRDIFSMRLADHRRRRQATQAKELAPRLPPAPRSTLPPP